ncbi:MAG: DUF4340 domain-containing protein [Candidatus Azotimanducaceae bacterium]
MEKKILLAIIAVIFSIVFISFFSRQSTDQDSVLLLPELEESLEELNLISFQSSQPESLLTIKTEPEGWVVVEAGGYPADLNRLSGFLRDLSQLKVLERKTKKEKNHARLGVSDSLDPPARLLKIEPGDFAFIIGTNAGESGSFVRVKGNPQVYLTENIFDFEARPDSWIDPVIIDVDPDKVQRIDITSSKGPPLSVFRDGDSAEFVLAEQPANSKLRYETILDGMARMLVNLRLVGVEKRTEVVLEDATETRFLLDSGEALIIKTQRIDGRHFLRLASDEKKRDWLYEISESSFQDLNKEMEDLLLSEGDND